MTKAEAFEILETIQCFYPNFEITQKKIDTWSKILKNDDFQTVMNRVERHATEKKFSPTIVDIREPNNPYKNDYLSKLEQWEREASGKPTS